MSELDNKYLDSTVLTLDGTNTSGTTVTKGSPGDTFLNTDQRRLRGANSTPIFSDEYVGKDFVEGVVATLASGAGIVKQTLLVDEQISDLQGVRPAFALYLATGNSILANEVITLVSDTYSGESFTEGTSFTGQVNASSDMLALVEAINAGTNFGAVYASDLVQLNDTEGVVVVYLKTTPGSSDDFRVYSNSGSSNLQVVSYQATSATDTVGEIANNYQTDKVTATFTISSGDPGSSVDYSGFSQTKANLVEPQTHVVLSSGFWFTWDGDLEQWNRSNGNSLVDATSAIGGGVKGKLTVDQEYSLYLASGILRIQLESSNPSLEFKTGTPKQLGIKFGNTSGITKNSNGLSILLDNTTTPSSGLSLTTDGLRVLLETSGSGNGGLDYSATGLRVKLATVPGLDLLATGIAVKPNTAKGIDTTVSGVEVKVDTSSIGFDSSGKLQLEQIITLPAIDKLTLNSTDISNGYKLLTEEVTTSTNSTATLNGLTSTNGLIPPQLNGVDFTIMREGGVDYVVWKTSGTVAGNAPAGTFPSVGLVGILTENDILHLNYTKTIYTPAV